MPFTLHRQRMTHELDLANLTGIEIGPLVNPIVTRDKSDVRYVDRASTEELCKWYSRDPKIKVDDIMQIDYIWGEQSLTEATEGSEQFDYCVASHVIEHIPDLITWLGEISSILKVGGVACFAVPDKRYTFDYLRPVTTTADVLDSYFRKLRKPSFRHIFDHFANYTELDIETAWRDDFDGSKIEPTNSPEHAYNACIDAMENDKYIDSHCSVFTEDSFFDLLYSISKLGLLDFKIRKNFSVEKHMFEFFVQLEKIDSSLEISEKHQLFQESLDDIKGTTLEIDFCCNQECNPKIYYDIGNGFNETDSQFFSYRKPNAVQTLKFSLPLKQKMQLRFDPADFAADFEISKINYSVKRKTHDIDLSTLTPLHDIAKIKPSSNGVLVKSKRRANDPALMINL